MQVATLARATSAACCKRPFAIVEPTKRELMQQAPSDGDDPRASRRGGFLGANTRSGSGRSLSRGRRRRQPQVDHLQSTAAFREEGNRPLSLVVPTDIDARRSRDAAARVVAIANCSVVVVVTAVDGRPATRGACFFVYRLAAATRAGRVVERMYWPSRSDHDRRRTRLHNWRRQTRARSRGTTPKDGHTVDWLSLPHRSWFKLC